MVDLDSDKFVVDPSGWFAVLTIDRQKLLLAQNEIRTLEPVIDIDKKTKLPGTVGTLTIQNIRFPVYCVSEDLTVLEIIPTNRRICVLLDEGENSFGITCDKIETTNSEHLKFYSLPECMSLQDSPILALAIRGNELNCVTSTGRLAAYIKIRKHWSQPSAS